MSKQIFHRIQFRRIIRQERHLNVTIMIIEEFLNQSTLVHSETIPIDEQLLAYLAVQRVPGEFLFQATTGN